MKCETPVKGIRHIQIEVNVNAAPPARIHIFQTCPEAFEEAAEFIESLS
jgi:hypothetical protein